MSQSPPPTFHFSGISKGFFPSFFKELWVKMTIKSLFFDHSQQQLDRKMSRGNVPVGGGWRLTVSPPHIHILTHSYKCQGLYST